MCFLYARLASSAVGLGRSDNSRTLVATQLVLAWQSCRAIPKFVVPESILDGGSGAPISRRAPRISSIQVLLGFSFASRSYRRTCARDDRPRIPAVTP